MSAASAIRIPVGERCQIQIDQTKYLSALRGYHDFKYVLLEAPLTKGKTVVAPTGLVYIVRFIFEGHVYGFEAQLIKQYGAPISLWVMKYPDDIQVVGLRKSKRITTFMPATLDSSGAAIAGALLDLSEGGGLFTTDQEGIAQDKTFNISFTLPSGEKVDALPCVARSVTKKEGRWMVGLSFNSDGDAINPVKSYYLLMAEQLF
ncbi:MAG: flagellar brake protein [Nitrospinae bacterium]|nr:flagellar brake protein [Nitrospinota bacterium]